MSERSRASHGGSQRRTRRRSNDEHKESYVVKLVTDKTPLVSPAAASGWCFVTFVNFLAEEEYVRSSEGDCCHSCDLFCPVGTEKHCQLIFFTSQMVGKICTHLT